MVVKLRQSLNTKLSKKKPKKHFKLRSWLLILKYSKHTAALSRKQKSAGIYTHYCQVFTAHEGAPHFNLSPLTIILQPESPADFTIILCAQIK